MLGLLFRHYCAVGSGYSTEISRAVAVLYGCPSWIHSNYVPRPGAGDEVHFGEYSGVPGCRLSRAQAFRC
jgi:hypothetical protein